MEPLVAMVTLDPTLITIFCRAPFAAGCTDMLIFLCKYINSSAKCYKLHVIHYMKISKLIFSLHPQIERAFRSNVRFYQTLQIQYNSNNCKKENWKNPVDSGKRVTSFQLPYPNGKGGGVVIPTAPEQVDRYTNYLPVEILHYTQALYTQKV